MKRFAIVGAGIISGSHKKALMDNEQCEIVAICDIDMEKAKKLSEGTNSKIYSDYREMQKNEDIDAVILNLPHFLHMEISCYFLENKVAVLVEKPMANSVEECDTMIRISKENNTPLAVGHVQRYYDCYRALKRIIENKELGKLCSFTETRNVDYFPGRPKWFLNKKQSGGGIVANYGAHTLDKLMYTTGLKVDSITAVGTNMLTEDDVEASAQLLMRFSDGSSGVCTYCGCHVPISYDTYFYFTDGAAMIKDGWELYISKNADPFEKADIEYGSDLFVEQLKEFLKYIDGEKSEVVTPEYGREIIRVLEEAFEQIDI